MPTFHRPGQSAGTSSAGVACMDRLEWHLRVAWRKGSQEHERSKQLSRRDLGCTAFGRPSCLRSGRAFMTPGQLRAAGLVAGPPAPKPGRVERRPPSTPRSGRRPALGVAAPTTSRRSWPGGPHSEPVDHSGTPQVVRRGPPNRRSSAVPAATTQAPPPAAAWPPPELRSPRHPPHPPRSALRIRLRSPRPTPSRKLFLTHLLAGNLGPRALDRCDGNPTDHGLAADLAA